MSPTSYQAALPRSLEFLSVVHSLVRVNDVDDLKCVREVNTKPQAALLNLSGEIKKVATQAQTTTTQKRREPPDESEGSLR